VKVLSPEVQRSASFCLWNSRKNKCFSFFQCTAL
jgi:hypothetical protein